MDAVDVFRLTSLTFVSGARVEVPRVGVVVVIGPNNVGKSTLLGELSHWVTHGVCVHNNRREVVLRSADQATASADNFMAWMEQFESPILPVAAQPEVRTYRNWTTSQQEQRAFMSNAFADPTRRHSLAAYLICGGAMATFEGPSPDFYTDGPGPMGGQNKQFDDLYADRDIERRISDLSLRIFGSPVELSRFGRQSVLHFGRLPPVGDPPTETQKAALRATPKVSEQGAGVREFLSLAITLELGQEPLVFLDEPDAHLHPPQAYAAGRFVAERGRRSQVFVVTHSLEFLHGIVDSGSEVTVIRLDRERDGSARVDVVSASDIEATWRDTAARYSGALAGLLHRGVVLCEGDGDCRYFEVALDSHTQDEPAHDLRFVQAGGKSGVKKLARALYSMAVPVSCVVDFDFLRDWAEVEELVLALGGDASALNADWKLLANHLTQKGDPRTIDDMRATIDSELSASENGTTRYDHSMHRNLKTAIRLKDGWTEAKKHGVMAAVGQPHDAARRLVTALKTFGIHVLPFGELESLHPGLSLHGPAFVGAAIEGELFKQLNLEQIEFVRSIRATRMVGKSTAVPPALSRSS